MNKTTSVFEIRLFGTPQLLLQNNSMDALRRKNRALIYYVAAQDGQAAREKILTLFWPDHERSAAQPILRTMVHSLRKHLGEYFQADDRKIVLAPDTFIDVQKFSAALNSPSTDLRKLKDALNLYKGDLLESFSLPDSPQFDDWVNSERERYQLMAMNGFADLAHRHEVLRDYPVALEAARRALAFNSFQEDLQRDVMRLLYLNGDRSGVIRQYESLRKSLDEELGVPPMPETRVLYDSLINDTFVPVPVETTSTFSATIISSKKPLLPLLGRDAELETLQSQLGSGKLILLEGEPGIGKTRLVSELIKSQTQGPASVFVLQGTSYELEQGLPYQPIVDALRNLLAHSDGKTLAGRLNIELIWLTELTRLLPELLTQLPAIPPSTQPADERRLWEALHQFIRALTEHGEVWLFLDDLHWADAATIALLGYLIRNISSPSFHLLATSRPLEKQVDLIKLLQVLNREDRLVKIRLSVLPESVMQQMAVVLSQKHNEQLSGWLIKNAEGNPFFVTELVRYAQRIGLLKKDGSLDLELLDLSPAVPVTIQNLIESRLLKLSENARHILHIAAIIGREFDFELARQVSSFSETDTLDAVEELQAAHLIKPLLDDKFIFDHSLTMQVALSNMNDTRRRFLHRRVAETLEEVFRNDLDPATGLIAHHFVEGNVPDRAKLFSVRAGQLASNLAAWAEALTFYQQALVLETVDAERASIFLAMGAAHVHMGEFALATKDFHSAVELAQTSKNWQLLEDAHLGFIQSLVPQARYVEAIEASKKLCESGPPELAVCAEFSFGASLSINSGKPEEAEHHLREAERLLRDQAGGVVTKITSLQIKYHLGAVLGQQGRIEEAVAMYREVSDSIQRDEGKLDTFRNIMLYNHLAYYAHLLGDASAARYAQTGIKLAQEKGSLSHLSSFHSTLGEIALAKGELDTAESHFQDGLRHAKQTPIPVHIAGLTANLGLVAKARGQDDAAREQLQKALNLVQPLGDRHLEVRIRIWLAPLLAVKDARASLNSARVLAEQGELKGLLEEIGKMEKELSDDLT